MDLDKSLENSEPPPTSTIYNHNLDTSHDTSPAFPTSPTSPTSATSATSPVSATSPPQDLSDVVNLPMQPATYASGHPMQFAPKQPTGLHMCCTYQVTQVEIDNVSEYDPVYQTLHVMQLHTTPCIHASACATPACLFVCLFPLPDCFC